MKECALGESEGFFIFSLNWGSLSSWRSFSQPLHRRLPVCRPKDCFCRDDSPLDRVFMFKILILEGPKNMVGPEGALRNLVLGAVRDCLGSCGGRDVADSFDLSWLANGQVRLIFLVDVCYPIMDFLGWCFLFAGKRWAVR